MTIDEVLTNISIHLHLSKETEHEILAEIRTHLEDAVKQAVILGEDEQAALQKAATDDSNVFAALMDAVRSCSLGQISDAFFEGGGQYRRNV